MGFHIYPDPQTDVATINPGMTSDVTLTVAQVTAQGLLGPDDATVAGDPPPTSFPTTVFIRVALLGAMPAPANRPTVLFGLGGSPPTELNASVGTQKAIPDPSNPGFDGAYGFRYDPDANNVYLVKVLVTNTSLDWQIKIKNNDGVNRQFTWVVASSLAESRQPWIHASPPNLTFTALVNDAAAQTAQPVLVTNRGTGPLNVSGTTPAVAAPFTIAGLPAMVPPNPAAALQVPVGFNAPATTADGPFTSFHFTHDDSIKTGGVGHNDQVLLFASSRKVEIVLALDDSGSMSWNAAGNALPAGDPNSRWSELRSAAKRFLELLAGFGENRGTFGIVRFPGKPGLPFTDETGYDLITKQNIPNLGGMAGAKNQLDLVAPEGWTPMYYALHRALTAALYFSNVSADLTLNRRWLLLMSDGAWNKSPLSPATLVGSFQSSKVKVFSAGYGTAGEVDYPTLKAISDGTSGKSVQVQTGGMQPTADELAHAFKTAITDGLSWINAAADPKGVIKPGKIEERHPVIITPYDTKAAFTISWNTPDTERLELQLLTPTCDLITPAAARGGKIPGVTFSSDPRYQLYLIDASYLRNDANPAQPRYGTWRMIVSSPKLADIQGTEHYSYDVLLESSLRMEVTLDSPVYYAGDKIGVSAKLTAKGLPITDAAVKLEVTMPGQGMDNWLAGISVSKQEYNEVAESMAKLDASPVFIKAVAAERKGFAFTPFTNKVSLPMTDPDHNGTYTATFSQTSVPDGYELYVTAVGTTADGVVFRREQSLPLVLGVRPDPLFTLIDLVYETISLAPDVLSAAVQVTPLDRFGNVVLVDPADSQSIDLQMTDAKIVDRLTTNYDGTYTTKMTYKTGARPSISLLVGGTPVVRNQPVVPVDQLQYVDEVLAFKPGLEGAPGANRHTNPNDILGDIQHKPAGVFVSLGAYGSLTAGIKGHSIKAQGDDDITVFVQPDSDLRPYRVEAMSVGKRHDWLPLGESAGITQSFSLRKANLDAASAIRITDTSGRTRDANLQPIATPGVSLRGIGVAKVGTEVMPIEPEDTDTEPHRRSPWHILIWLLIGLLVGLLIGFLAKC